MLPIKQASNSKRALLYSQIFFSNAISIFSQSSSSYLLLPPPSTRFCYYTTTQALPLHQVSFLNPRYDFKHLAQSIKEWFLQPENGLLDRIYEILNRHDEVDELALSQLNIRLTESLVLEVLRYGNRRNDVLFCIKFFDWAGRQHGFYHTRNSFQSIFKILSKAKLMPLMLDFLDNFMRIGSNCSNLSGFYNTLVLGYSVAGRPFFALQLFGRMRFQGLDLDPITYHALLGSLVEENCFEAVDSILRHIRASGFESHVTHGLVVKSFCKQKMLNEAESYLRRAVLNSHGYGLGIAVGSVVDAFCKEGKFVDGKKLIEEFEELGLVPMDPAYGAWVRNLVHAQKLDEAMEFLHLKKSLGSYVPHASRYNALLFRLLKENNLLEAFNLLVEMMESGISPDKITMNAVLCFFCKVGMMEVALELYNSKSEFALSPTSMTYNYLINSLCREGNINDAYLVFKNSTQQGCLPGKRTFSALVDVLCRERKLDMIKEIMFIALKQNLLRSDFLYAKFISALCRINRLEDCYLIHQEYIRMDKVPSRTIYSKLIHGFNKLNRVDISCELLIEMLDKGHEAARPLFRSVILTALGMENPQHIFFQLLNMQLSRLKPNCQIYNLFIDGAGHARQSELAREVFDMMVSNGIEHNVSSYIFMLQSYLKSRRISDALIFFDDLRRRAKLGRKLYNTMVVGLCKVDQVNYALSTLWEVRNNGKVPSIECYEVLIHVLCSHRQYDMAINLLYDLEKVGRRVTSFIGNVLLLHSMRSEELFDAWVQARDMNYETSYNLSYLCQLIGAFSGRVRLSQEVQNFEEVIEQSFPLDLFTYNILLRKIIMNSVEDATKFYCRLLEKGYEPNKWTYEIFVIGLVKHGRKDEAMRLVDEMFKHGVDITNRTRSVLR